MNKNQKSLVKSSRCTLCIILGIGMAAGVWSLSLANPRVLSIQEDRGKESMELSVEGLAGHVYLFQKSTNLTAWSFIPDYAVGQGSAFQRWFLVENGPLFFRVLGSDDPDEPWLSADYNQTGISAWDQIHLGYNPFLTEDADFNGLPDVWEVFHYGAIGVDEQADSDQDNLSNILEFYLGTNPRLADEDLIAITPPPLKGAYATPGSVYLDWRHSLSEHSISRYEVFRDGQKIAAVRGYPTSYTDATVEAGSNYTYSVTCVNRLGESSAHTTVEVVTPMASNIPGPWGLTDFNGSDLGPGYAAYHEAEDMYVLSGATRDILNDFCFLYQVFEGDFSITVRVHGVEPTAYWSKAGLAVMNELSSQSLGLSYAFSGKSDAQIQKREVYGAGSGARTTPGVDTEGWLRIVRKGDQWDFYASYDAQNWLRVGHEQLALNDRVYLGIGFAGNNTRKYGSAVFSDLVVEDRNDSDNDGLTDEEEAELGLDPRNADTDGDGFSDFEETMILFSDPEKVDIGSVQVVQQIEGSDRTDSLGAWAGQQDGSLVARDQRGWLEYQVTLPSNGMYRLSLALTEPINPGSDSFHELEFYMGGHFVNRVQVLLDRTESAFAQVITPYLAAGTHTLKVFWDNTLTYRRIAIQSLEVQHLENFGWVQHRLRTINGVLFDEARIQESHISPLQIEGWSKHMDYTEVQWTDGTSLPVQPSPGGQWFCELPLENTNTVQTALLSMENDALQFPVFAKWVAYDLFSRITEEMNVRIHDRLKLCMSEADSDQPGELLIESPDGTISQHTFTKSLAEVTVIFLVPGAYRLRGSLPGISGGPDRQVDLSVHVFDDQLAGDRYLKTSLSEMWSHPKMSFESEFHYDSRLTITEVPPLEGARTFQVGTVGTRPLLAAARLPENGTILDTASVKGVRVSSSLQTSFAVTDVFTDGTEVVTMPVVVSPVVPGMEVRIRIAVQGVTFVDGSLVKILTADDFDELGRATVRFLKAKEVSTSNCYRISVTFPETDGGEP